MQLVSAKVVKKYRESELKHGRLAMLATVGFVAQESFHPFHPDIGGLAITHMEQLRDLPIERSIAGLIPGSDKLGLGVSLDYILVLALLSTLEVYALKRNWTRWRRNEYAHQFDHNIGIGNLKEVPSS
jgi:hypothetical protein